MGKTEVGDAQRWREAERGQRQQARRSSTMERGFLESI
jgi:hypothetical protein